MSKTDIPYTTLNTNINTQDLKAAWTATIQGNLNQEGQYIHTVKSSDPTKESRGTNDTSASKRRFLAAYSRGRCITCNAPITFAKDKTSALNAAQLGHILIPFYFVGRKGQDVSPLSAAYGATDSRAVAVGACSNNMSYQCRACNALQNNQPGQLFWAALEGQPSLSGGFVRSWADIKSDLDALGALLTDIYATSTTNVQAGKAMTQWTKNQP